MTKVFVVSVNDADEIKAPAAFGKEEEARAYLVKEFVEQFDDEEIIKIDKALKKAKLNKSAKKPDYSLHLWLRYWEGMEDDEEYDEEEFEYTEEDDELYDDNGIAATVKRLNVLCIFFMFLSPVFIVVCFSISHIKEIFKYGYNFVIVRLYSLLYAFLSFPYLCRIV